MNNDDFWDKFWEFIKKGGGLIIGFLVWLLLLEFLKKTQPPRVPDYEYKSVLAEEYGVSVDILMGWVDRFLPEEYQKRLKGKVKTIDPHILHKHLGEPKDRPKNDSGEYIFYKPQIAEYLNMTPKTFKRRMNKIEDPEISIQMKMETYSKCDVLPPRYVFFILLYFGKVPGFDSE